MAVRKFGNEELNLLREVLNSGNLSSLTGGKMTPRFEEKFAKTLGAKYGVAMNGAMSVLHSSVIASGAGPGDEVLCDPFCVFGAMAVIYNNAIPVFVDIKPDTFNMDPDLIEKKITDKTKALIVTHIFGLPAEIDRIVKIAHRHNLVVIEDCAHAILATYKGKYAGTWGDIGSFSFQMSKQLGLGDGGMAVTNSKKMRDLLALNAGAPTFKAIAYGVHYNYRITEQTAAIGIAQLKRMQGYIGGMREIAHLYDEAVEGCPFITLQRGPEEAKSSYHLWGATFKGEKIGVSMEKFRQSLKKNKAKIDSIGYTNMPAYMHPVIQNRVGYGKGCPFNCPLYRGNNNKYTKGLCPVAEEVIPKVLMIMPMGLKEDHARNAKALRKAWEGCVK